MLSTTSLLSPRWLRWIFAALAVLGGFAVGGLVVMTPSTMKVIVIVVGMAAGVAAMLRVEWGLLALVWMTYTRFSDVLVDTHGAPSTAQPFIALMILVILVRWAIYNERPEGWQQAAFLIAAYGMIGLATMLYASDTYKVRYGVITYAKDAIIAVLVVSLIRSPQMLRRSIWALLAAGIFLATLTTWQQLTGTFSNNYWGFARASIENIIVGKDDYRIAGPIGDPNFYAQILLVLVPIALDRIWSRQNNFQFVMAVWALAVCLLSILFTFSRGAFMSLAIALFLMFVRRPPKPITLLLTIMLVLPAVQFLPNGYLDRLSTILDLIPGLSDTSVKEEYSFRGRSSAQLAGWLMFRDHPITGVGIGNFPVHYQEYSRTLGIDSSRWEQAPHNLYLEILTERGLIGLAAFGTLLFFLYRGMKQARETFTHIGMDDEAGMVLAFSIGLASYLIAATFLQASYPRFFWVLVGIGFAMPNVAARAQRKREEALNNG